jgi:predicted DNA-binding transcriptional regulator AlpA
MNTQPTPTSEPLLLNARQAAALCGKAVRTWRTWHASGLIPRPVRIGRSMLWRADELRAWIAADCPNQQQWNISRNQPSAALEEWHNPGTLSRTTTVS